MKIEIQQKIPAIQQSFKEYVIIVLSISKKGKQILFEYGSSNLVQSVLMRKITQNTSSWTLTFKKKKLLYLIDRKPFKNDKNAFCSILKSLFVLKIFKFLSHFLVMQEKRLDQKDEVSFKVSVTTYFTNNCNTHIAQYLTK